MNLPNIRENLLVQDLDDEVLIYDLTTNKSYCLNETAKTVFNACDGVKTFADLNLPEEIIYLSLDELKKQNLIQSDYVSPLAGMNRREVIRKVGFASMVALPLVSSLIAPTAAMAASGGTRTQGQSCSSSADCASSAPVCATSGNASGTCCTAGGNNRMNGQFGPFLTNGTCQRNNSDVCQARVGSSCCDGTAVETDCITDSQTQIFLTCNC